jgi:hypothetical protein
VRAKASVKTALTDFLSVPKIMGIGPIMITPALRTFPYFAPPVEARIIAATMIMIPTITNAMPIA